MRTPTISPMSDSVRRALVMSRANVAVGLTALEQVAQRLDDPALEALGVGAHALARQEHEGVPDVDEGPHGTDDALLRRHLVDPGRASPASASLTAASASSSNSACRFGEVAVHRGPRDPGRGGDVVHARLLALEGERPRRSFEDRGGNALLKCLPGSRIGHRCLVPSLDGPEMRC